MKHLLNDLSNEEKNRIREQYEGGMSVDNSRFKKLMESKLGNVKPLIMEQPTGNTTSIIDTGLQIDCTRRVITKTNIHLTKEMNYIVIGAFCDMKNRNTEKTRTAPPPPPPPQATNESKLGNVKSLIVEQESGIVINLPSDAPIKDEKGNYLKDDESLTLYNGDENTGGRGMVLFKFDLNDIPQIKDIPNVVSTAYAKDKKYWERINDFQIRLI